jgi:hypothetical protein
MRHAVSPFVVAATLMAATPAVAQMYKCSGSGGTPIYQDVPCPEGRELRNFATDPATVSVLPMRPPPGSTTRIVAPRERPERVAKGSKKAQTTGDPAERRHLQLGMHEGEVLARLGAPDLRSKGGKVARWTYMPVPGDPQTLTTVVFEYGKVIEVERKVVP